MVYLQLLIGEGVQAEVHALAACHVSDQALKALRARVSNVVIPQAWESLQQELALGSRSHRGEDLHNRYVSKHGKNTLKIYLPASGVLHPHGNMSEGMCFERRSHTNLPAPYH